MRLPLRLAAAVPVLLGAATALAQNTPPTFPVKDVSVVYKVQGGPPMQMSWLATEQRVRILMAGAPGIMLVDVKGRKGFIVMDDQKAAMEMPPDDMPAAAGAIPDGAKLTKGKTETVAGHTCTTWLVEYKGTRNRSCVTSDGVMLRVGPDGKPASLEATRVIFGAQNPVDFRVPDGYEVVPLSSPPRDNQPARRR